MKRNSSLILLASSGWRTVGRLQTMRCLTVRAFVSLAIFLFALGGVIVRGGMIDESWIGGNGTAWGTAANWSGGVVPNNSDGTNYNVTLPTSGAYGVYVNVNATIDNLTVDTQDLDDGSSGAGTLNVTGNVYVNPTAIVNAQKTRVAGTFYNESASVDLPFAASDYVQSGDSDGYIFGTSNTNATIDGGGLWFACSSTLNGNLTMNGGGLGVGGACNNGSALIDGNLVIAAPTFTEVSLTPGSGPLSVAGDATLAGTLLVDIYGLPPLPSYEIMTYSAETGTFEGAQVSGWPGTYTLEYGPDDLTLLFTPAVPEPFSVVLVGGGLLVLSLLARRKLAKWEC